MIWPFRNPFVPSKRDWRPESGERWRAKRGETPLSVPLFPGGSEGMIRVEQWEHVQELA